MLQWLYTYVARVCLQCFICFPDVCCKRVYLDVVYIFIHMLQVFYLYVVYVLQWFSSVFASVLSVFFCILQVLHLNVLKIDLAHGIRVESWRGHERSPRVRVMFGGMGPAWPRDTGADKQHSAGTGLCVDTGKQTVAVGVWTSGR